jgi:predicted metal-binding membrane protein
MAISRHSAGKPDTRQYRLAFLRRLTFLTRDEAIVMASLAAITVLAWLYLVDMARDMAEMGDMVGMPEMADMAGMALVTPRAPWMVGDVMTATAMWAIMMAGMMLPTAVPMTLIYARASRGSDALPLLSSAIFTTGYLAIWCGFALAAVLAQFLLLRFDLFAPEMMVTNMFLGGALFLAAGLYECSPLKNRCLAQCQTPLGFLITHWRPGLAGAWRMGARHGTYCLGCCWVLMLLLFVGGVMNLLWVAALSILVLLQKLVPGKRAAQGTGLVMLIVGLVLIGKAIVA